MLDGPTLRHSLKFALSRKLPIFVHNAFQNGSSS